MLFYFYPLPAAPKAQLAGDSEFGCLEESTGKDAGQQ